MAKVLTVGGPKGGVGKSTVAVNLATHSARILGLRTAVVDADENDTSTDQIRAAIKTDPSSLPVKVVSGYGANGDEAFDPAQLTRLRQLTRYDLVIVDLPGHWQDRAVRELIGRRTGAGDTYEPVVDGLILPTPPELTDIRPLRRRLQAEILPLGVPYLVAVVRAKPQQMTMARKRRDQLAERFSVATTVTRDLVAHNEAVEARRPLMDMPADGRRSTTAAALREYLHLSIEAFELIDLDTTPLRAYLAKET